MKAKQFVMDSILLIVDAIALATGPTKERLEAVLSDLKAVHDDFVGSDEVVAPVEPAAPEADVPA